MIDDASVAVGGKATKSELSVSLLGVLSDNFLNQSQTNTGFYKMIKMDRVGVEPTTSARMVIVSTFI
jgi:hypothetical protein